MKKLLLLLLLSLNLSAFADSHLDFSLSDFCYQQPGVQDRDGVFYFPNDEVGITSNSLCVYKDAYGQYESKGELIEGKFNGNWIWWNTNGEKSKEHYFINGESVSVICIEDYLHFEFERNEIYYLTDEPFTGRNMCKHENGEISMEGNVINGKQEGRWVVRYKNGQLFLEINFNNGKRDGKQTGWFENGQKGGEENYKDGKLDGKRTEWYENGQIDTERNYKDGEENGKFTDWYEDGQKSWERTIKNGWFDGKVTEWHENGQVKSQKLYANEKCISGC